jgi:hypothetical protein
VKRRLALRDRAAWFVAVLALGVVVYLVFPLWVVVAAVAVLIIVPVLARRQKRQRVRR